MSFARKILMGKEAYNLDRKSYEIIGDPQYENLIIKILGPIKKEVSNYSYKNSSAIKQEFISIEVVDYIHGFVCSGLRVNKYGEWHGEERYKRIKEAFLVGIFGPKTYLGLLKDDIFSLDNNVSQEFNEGEYTARIRKDQEDKNRVLLDDDLPELGAILFAQKTTREAVKKLKK